MNKLIDGTRRLAVLPIGATICVIGGGCKNDPSATSEYSTISADPRRNTDKAREQTAMSLTLIEQGKLPEAEATLKAALDADITFGPAHNNLGRVYYEQSRLYLSAWEFHYAIKLMPYAAEPRNNLGLVLEAAGKLDEAVTNFDAALLITPDHPAILANNARARIRRGDRDDHTIGLLNSLAASDAGLDWTTWARGWLSRIDTKKPTTTP